MLVDTESLRTRLGPLGVSARREEEILRELAEHLADQTEEMERDGLPGETAAREALRRVTDWPELRDEIIRAETEEVTMNYEWTYRTKALWLPALGALILSNVLLALMQIFGPPPRFHWLSANGSVEPYVVFFVPWLISQPVVGAIAAYWSRRARGTVRHQLLAALAPAIALLGFFLLVLPVSFIVDRQVSHDLRFWTGVLVMTATWVVLPGVPLLLGAAPFLRKPQPQS
jgi:hypothetical protein